MNTPNITRMTSTEVASLWTQYLNETMDICVKEYVLQQVEDAEIRSVFELSKGISKNHVAKIKEFFNKETTTVYFTSRFSGIC